MREITYFSLLEDPLTPVLLDSNRPLLVQTDTTRMKDGGGQDRVRQRWEAMSVKIFGFALPSVNSPCGVDELLDRDIAVSTLSIKVATGRRRIFHTKRTSD